MKNRPKDTFEREMEREGRFDRVVGTLIAYIVLGCVAAILIGLAVNVPWLGIPLVVLGAVAMFLFW